MSEKAAAVLKNVFQFATILNQASNSEVQKWDGISLSNALDWAAYCQELYQRLKDQPFENDFNCQLAQMTMLLRPVSCLYLTLDSLQNAIYLLVNTLMCNSNLSAQLHGKLKAALAKTQDGDDILSKVQHQISRIKNAEDLYTSLLRSPDAGAETRETKSEFEANFLVCHLINVVSSAKKKDRFESYCHGVCDKLMQSPDGNNIFMKMFRMTTDDLEPERRRWLQVVLDHLASWLQRRIRQDSHNCPLLKASVKDVVYAAGVHPQFFSIYLDALSAWTDSCVPEVQRSGCLLWRSPDGVDSLAVTRHFQCLLLSLSSSADQSRRSRVVSLIAERVRGREFTAWRSVATHLLHLLKQG